MNALDALKAARLVKVKGERFVVLPAEEWEALIEWLEDIEDAQIVEKAIRELQSADGDPEKAGWLKWEDVEKELR